VQFDNTKNVNLTHFIFILPNTMIDKAQKQQQRFLRLLSTQGQF
jgi:hypothetical protein